MNTQALRRARLQERFDMAMESDRDFVLTPCIGVCHMDPQSHQCEGCLREIQEIARWGSFDDAQKRAIWLQIKLRMNPLGPTV
jgi:predicted Fe-S protein YdhL (DUF1289 family)